MKKTLITLISTLFLGLVVAGCGGEQETKNMEQIYAEEGVPVVTETVEPSTFNSKLEFNAVLTGLKESSAYAMVDDKIDLINYSIGDYIEKDAIVLTFPTDNPSARYFQSKIAYENAEANFGRMKSFYEVGGLSRQEFENAEASYGVAKANWDAVRQSVLVKAPISGVLTRMNFLETENVHCDDELFAISRIDRLKARVPVSDKEIGDIEIGQEATADWNGSTLQGKVVQVDLSMNQKSQAFGVVVEFDNPDMSVRGGVTAKIAISTYNDEQAVYTERKNVIKEAGLYHVFVAENGVAKKRDVKLGRSGGIDVEILSGLNPGDILITEGQLHLDDGKKIRTVETTEPEMRASN